MKSVNVLTALALTFATSLTFASSKEVCLEDGLSTGGRDPYGYTPAESISKDMGPRLENFLKDCDVQSKLPKLEGGVKIEVRGFMVAGIMGTLTYSIQDFNKHQAVDCTIEGGYETDMDRTPRGPGPVVAMAFLKKTVRVTCGKPYHS